MCIVVTSLVVTDPHMKRSLNLEEGTFSEYFYVPSKHVKKYIYSLIGHFNGDHLSFIFTAAKNRYLEQGSTFQCRVIKTLLPGTIELGPYELEEQNP